MTLNKADASLIIDTAHPGKIWCVYEHLVSFAVGQPPEVIMVGACKLPDVHRLIDGARNSEWQKIFRGGGSVMVRVVATGTDQVEVQRHAMAHMRSYPNLPRCNLKGFSTKGTSQRIECVQNGVIYDSQKDACMALGLHTSAVSRHMRGDLKHVGGYTFRLAPDGVEMP